MLDNISPILRAMLGLKRILCFHHKDGDGFCSAAIVRQFFSREVKFYGMDYKTQFPFDDIRPGDGIIIVDFSPNSSSDFARMLEITEYIVWIDHHKTAIEKHNHFDYIEGKREVGTAACMLTWQYFNGSEQPPRAVELLADYDVWTFAYGDDTRHFQAGMRSLDMRPQNHLLWNLLLNDNIECLSDIKNTGKILTEYNKTTWEKMLRAIGYRTTLDGLKCVACNVQGSSAAFESLNDTSVDAVIVYGHSGDSFKVTIYSHKEGVDVSQVASAHGGGGHAGAAGFFCNSLPFKFEKKLAMEDFK